METVYLYLQDIGTGSHTQFTVTEEILDLYDHKPNLEECKQAMIHSHNTMTTFFSNEDNSELEDNYKFYDFFLSLIVNNVGDRLAKIAIPCQRITKSTGTLTTRIIMKDAKGQDLVTSLAPMPKDEETSEDIMLTADIIIEIPEVNIQIDPLFINRISELKNVAATAKTKYPVVKGFNNTKWPESYNSAEWARDYRNEYEAQTTNAYHFNDEILTEFEILKFAKLMFSKGSTSAGTLRSVITDSCNKYTEAQAHGFSIGAMSLLQSNYKEVFNKWPSNEDLISIIDMVEDEYLDIYQELICNTIISDTLMDAMIKHAKELELIKYHQEVIKYE